MPKPSPAQCALLVWGLVLLLTGLSLVPQPPAEDDSGHFAGQHALEVLSRVLPTDTPHPLGSHEQALVRHRIATELRALGFQPTLQEHWVCSPLGQCGRVHNLTLEIPGPREEVVLFSAHTDSAAAGPGAGDDGHAIAILIELARHIARGTVTPENTVLLLFNEGEERGLLGALSFLERDPRTARVVAAVNLEARGNAGPSMLFQTVGENAWLINAYATEARRPHASSLAQVVYEIMPNYTDLTAFHRFGIPGVDFAFIDGESAYHSPLDTVERLSPRSLQSQGDNALAMLRALGTADLDDPPRGHAVWFDVLQQFVVRAPRDLVAPLSLLSWLTALAASAVGRRRGRVRGRRILAAIGLALLALTTTTAAGWAACFLTATLMGESIFWAANPWPVTLALVTLSIGVTISIARRTSLAGLDLILGHALLLTTLALPLSLFAPGATYLLGVPAAVLTLGAVVALLRSDFSSAVWWIGGLTGFVSLVLWLPILAGIRLALGVSPLIALGAALGGLGLWPLWQTARPGLGAAMFALSALGCGLTIVQAPFDEDAPRREWLTRVVQNGDVRLLRGPGPSQDAGMMLSGEDRTAAAPAHVLDEVRTATPPIATAHQPLPSDALGRPRLALRLKSPEGAPTLIVSIPPSAGVHSLSIEDTSLPPGRLRGGGAVFLIHDPPPEGVRIEAVLDDPTKPWRLADRRPWPDAPEALRSTDARTSWEGDTTWVLSEIDPAADPEPSP